MTMITQNIQNNPNNFFHIHKDNNGVESEVCVDFQTLLSFCKTIESDGSIELSVLFSNQSKAYYSFHDEEPYNRFVSEYDSFLIQRAELVSVAREMAADIAREMTVNMKEVTETIIKETLKDIEKSANEQMESFKNRITDQAALEVEKVLAHQREINSDMSSHLVDMKKIKKESIQFVDEIKEFKDRLSGINKVLDLVAPSSESAMAAELLERQELEQEVSSI